MKFILGRKIEMSQIFKDNGEVVPVTVVQAGPCIITQIRTQAKDKYAAVQIGFEESKRLGKSLRGHLKGLKPVSELKEFRLNADEAKQLERGQTLSVGIFNEGELVKVTGVSKGKGFAGVVKRHHFAGQSTSHGTKDQVRMPGSSGMGGVQRVFKNTRKPGRMGGDQITVSNLEVVRKDNDKNLLYIKGAVPGSRHSLIMIYNGEALDLELLNPVEAEVLTVAETAPVEAAVSVESPVEAPAEAVETAPVAETPANDQPAA